MKMVNRKRNQVVVINPNSESEIRIKVVDIHRGQVKLEVTTAGTIKKTTETPLGKESRLKLKPLASQNEQAKRSGPVFPAPLAWYMPNFV